MKTEIYIEITEYHNFIAEIQAKRIRANRCIYTAAYMFSAIQHLIKGVCNMDLVMSPNWKDEAQTILLIEMK